MSTHSPRRRRQQRGQALVESTLVLSLLFIGFFFLLYYGYLGIAKIIGYHATFVTARSHIVGFSNEITLRAMEVGSIGLAGRPITPDEITTLSPAELGAREPTLIPAFLQARDYTMDYQYWHKVNANLPLLELDGVVPVRVWVYDYRMGGSDYSDDEVPLPMGIHELSTDINRDYWLHLYNHSALYLED